ncbi:MAG: asparagine synthase (glutamine-hydrolyzing) [Melioribacteraceae bacterium]
MSWFLGGVGHFNEEFLSTIKQLTPSPLMQTASDSMFLFAGGIPNTCKFQLDNSLHKKKWLQVGIGISQKSPRKFLSNDDWNQIVTNGDEEKIELDGHYVLLSWDLERLIFVTDKLGLRDFYYCNDPHGNVFFSTRIDWLAKLIPTEINFEEFGSRWLLLNQISPNSVLKNITRVISGDSIMIDRKTKKISFHKNKFKTPKHNLDNQSYNFNDRLNELILFPLAGNEISLSFSGGLDSRLLFSYLLGNKERNWDAHTFGDENHPDAVIAKQICNDFDISHKQIQILPPSPDQFIIEFKDYIGQTIVNNSASSFLQLRNYSGLEGTNQVIIDGGFGEIWRREFFNRLLFLGSKFILNGDIEKIIPHLRLYRADIFSEEVKLVMLEGSKKQLEIIFSELPSPDQIGLENWIDLFAAKTRIQNYYSHEQSRLDLIVTAYMPFLQPSMLEELFAVPLDQRKNGKLFKFLIKNNAKNLVKYPLVKGQMLQPIWMNTLQSRAWNFIRKKIVPKTDSDIHRKIFFKKMSPFILDIANSQSVRQCNFYNHKKISTLTGNLQKENYEESVVNELDWWLSFELFRQQIEQSKGF